MSVNSLKYQFEIANLYVTSSEFFIFYSYRWFGGIRGTHACINGDNLFFDVLIILDPKVLKMSPHFQRWLDKCPLIFES